MPVSISSARRPPAEPEQRSPSSPDANRLIAGAKCRMSCGKNFPDSTWPGHAAFHGRPQERRGQETPQHGASAAGSGTGDRRRRRRSVGHCDLLAGRRAVWLRPALDGVSHHAVHDRDPARQRADRPGHRQGACRQCDGARAALAGAGAGFPAGRRQHVQHRGRHRRDGGIAVAGDRRPRSRTCADFRVGLHPAAGVRAVSAICSGAEIHDAHAVRLCRNRLYREHPLEQGAAGCDMAASHRQCRLFPDGGRGARHHHQPISVFLAGFAGSRGNEPAQGAPAASRSDPRRT